MADSYSKKERAKKKRKKQQEKMERREQRKQDGPQSVEFMYVDENGHLSPTPPDPAKKPKIKAEDITLGVPPKDADDAHPAYVRSGTVKFFNTEKGYGFIDDDESQESYFVHINDLDGEISERDKVRFEVGKGPKGPVALNVRLVGN